MTVNDLFGVSERVPETLTVEVEKDTITQSISESFDYAFTGESRFTVPDMGDVPKDFVIGLIVGASGSGKSTLLSRFGKEEVLEWNPSKAVCSHFNSAEEASQKLSAVGFNSIPAWMRPYHVLSTGEAFRADLARRLKDGCVIDEFTSVVDRNVAKSCARSVSRHIKENGLKNVVFASCHYDIIEWLEPDWVFDTSTGELITRGLERRPEITLEVLPCTTEAWKVFSQHHYLDGNINKSSRCWIAVWNGQLVGFAAAIAYPSGTVKNAWRGHRTVILPDFQGLGLGVRLSDAIAEIFVSEGCRYFSKTSHPRMGEYRQNSPNWKPTSKNLKKRHDYLTGEGKRVTKEDGHKHKHFDRMCFSHEYIRGE